MKFLIILLKNLLKLGKEKKNINKNYWSKLTKISISQFSKSYIKLHTGKRKRKGYKGSVRIRYYDSDLEKEIREIYTLLPVVLNK